jgi:hypothetical protein
MRATPKHSRPTNGAVEIGRVDDEGITVAANVNRFVAVSLIANLDQPKRGWIQGKGQV